MSIPPPVIFLTKMGTRTKDRCYPILMLRITRYYIEQNVSFSVILLFYEIIEMEKGHDL